MLISQITGVKIDQISESSKLVTDLHLDSLMRVELVAWIEEDLNILINETDICSSTTIKQLEELINAKKPITESPKLKKWPRSNWIVPFRFIGQQLFFLLFKPFIKLKVSGLENLKDIKFPVVFMPNHISYVDSLIIAQALPWHIRKKLSFAAAQDVLYNYYKIFSIITEATFNSFPIQRRDQENIKLGLDFIGQMLDQQYSVVLFPEGQTSQTGQLLPLKKGAGLIATEMNVLIVPVKIEGSSKVVPYGKIFPRARGLVTVKFGKPIKFKRSDSYTEATQKIQETIMHL